MERWETVQAPSKQDYTRHYSVGYGTVGVSQGDAEAALETTHDMYGWEYDAWLDGFRDREYGRAKYATRDGKWVVRVVAEDTK